MKKTLLISLLGAFTSLTIPTLSATTLLNPGASNQAPDIFSTPNTGLTFLASTGVQTITTSTFTATYTEWVYSDTGYSGAMATNAGLCLNCLDFFIELTDVSGDALQRISTGSFVGFNTAAGYNTAAVSGINGGVAVTGVIPSTVDRSVSGATVGFNFQSANITPGESSALLEIQTNAVNYNSAFVSAQDDTAGSAAGFQPTTAPEPGTMALFGLGFIGLGMAKVRGGKKSA